MDHRPFVVFEGLPFGSLHDALVSLGDLYAELEAATGGFASGSGLACPGGCGSCCEGFVPDILPLEAAWMAAWLIRNDDGRARALAEEGFGGDERESRSCPFFVREGSRHCGVYGGRPLVCRLFGFSASRSKVGAPVFSLCSHMPPPPRADRRSWKGGEIAVEFGLEPPGMGDYGARLAAIRPGEQGDRRLIYEALPEALRRLFFLRGFAAAEPEDDPDGNRPLGPREGRSA